MPYHEVDLVSCEAMAERRLKYDNGWYPNKRCQYCYKGFKEKKMFEDHLKFDFSCWKVRKQSEKKRSEKLRKMRADASRNYEFEYDSDSGRGTASDSSICNDEDSINIIEDEESEVLIIGEKIRNTIEEPAAKRRRTEQSHGSKTPMVSIKSEVLDIIKSLTVKQEDAANNNLTDTQDDVKPTVPACIKPSSGIRLLIDKTNMSVVMASADLEDDGFVDDGNEKVGINCNDVKPPVVEIDQNANQENSPSLGKGRSDAGIRLLIDKNDMSVLLVSEPGKEKDNVNHEDTESSIEEENLLVKTETNTTNVNNKAESGIRLLIDKNDMSVLMVSDVNDDTGKETDKDVEPLTDGLDQNVKAEINTTAADQHAPGIRLLIDKNDMSILMVSENVKECSNSSCQDTGKLIETDVKPLLCDSVGNVKAGIKMTLEKEAAGQNNYAVAMASELVPNNMYDTEYIMCKNDECPKIGDHICIFPPFREAGGFYKTKGALNKMKSFSSGKPEFVPFNKTFLKKFGCTFYFKAFHSHIEIRSKTLNNKNSERFKVILYQNDVKSSTIGTLSSNKYKSSSAIATNNFVGNFIKYKILVDKNPRSCYLYD